MAKQMKFKFYSDPGHGWLAVKRKVLEDLGILNLISVFSYQRGATVYLEEDCDAGIFINAMKAKGLQFMFGTGSAVLDGTPEDKLVRVETKHTRNDKPSPIRSYDSFKVTA